MKLTEDWFKEKENFLHYIDLIPDMLNDIIQEATIRWCCNYEEFQLGFKPIREQILDDYEKARKWDRVIKDSSKFAKECDQNQKLRELIDYMLSPDLEKGNFDIDAPEDCLEVCQKLLEERKK